MTNQEQRRLERLNNVLRKLQDEIMENRTMPEKDLDVLCEKIRKAEEKIRVSKKETILKAVNKKHKERKQILKTLLDTELPKEDITNNDGTFHASKIKKYPQIMALKDRFDWLRLKIDGNCNTYIKVEIGRDSYDLVETIYKSGEPNEYKPFESFESALSYNRIRAKETTLKQFLSLEKKILKESKRIKEEVEKSYQKIKELDSYFLENENLITRRSSNYYEYY